MDFRQGQAYGAAVEGDLIAVLDASGRAPQLVEDARSIVRDAGPREALVIVAEYLAEAHVTVPADVRRRFRTYCEHVADDELLEVAGDLDSQAGQLAA